MSNTKKYGNNNYWCFLDDVWDGKEVAIWKGPTDSEGIIARAVNKYEAKSMVDALLNYKDDTNTIKFGKKEITFLEFVSGNCVEPYATMASNAILWNDIDAYNKLISDFPLIYS